MCRRVVIEQMCSPDHIELGEDSLRTDHYIVCDKAIEVGHICENADDEEHRIIWISDDQFNLFDSETKNPEQPYCYVLSEAKKHICWECINYEVPVVFDNTRYESLAMLIAYMEED
jgi:hypothetical protein